MMIYFFIFAVSFMTVYLTTPSIRYIALGLSVIDKKNHRKVHTKVVAKLGGLAIYLGFLGGLTIVAVLDASFFNEHIFQVAGMIICSTLVLMLGIFDDFQGSSALNKFLIQITLALLLIKIGFKLERIFIPGVADINTGSLSVPLTILWIAGITNAINLIDGLDGLAAGLIAIFSLFFAIYGILLGEKFVVYASLALMGANAAFLKYNFYPAKIFMGDTGSLFLGFVIAAMALYRPNPEDPSNPFFFPACILLFIPILDTTLAVMRRIVRRQHVFKSDFSHIHHYCIKRGFSQVHVVTLFYLITVFLGLIAFSIIYAYRHL